MVRGAVIGVVDERGCGEGGAVIWWELCWGDMFKKGLWWGGAVVGKGANLEKEAVCGWRRLFVKARGLRWRGWLR